MLMYVDQLAVYSCKHWPRCARSVVQQTGQRQTMLARSLPTPLSYYTHVIYTTWTRLQRLKPGFHYQSWRPELTARVDGWPVFITRQHGPSTRVVETGLYIQQFIGLRFCIQHSRVYFCTQTRKAMFSRPRSSSSSSSSFYLFIRTST